MAVTDAGRGAPPWSVPHWPIEPAPDRKLRAYYNPPADELVVRFVGGANPVVTVAIGTPERDYAHLLVDAKSGAVVGVQVDDLLAWAVCEHPQWRLLAWPDVAERQGLLAPFLAEVAALFARYGTMPD